MVSLPGLAGLPAEVKQLIELLPTENTEQKRTIAELREEIARLKGLKGRPDIKPSKPSGRGCYPATHNIVIGLPRCPKSAP